MVKLGLVNSVLRKTLYTLLAFCLTFIIAVINLQGTVHAQDRELLANDPNLIVLTNDIDEYNLVKHGVITEDAMNKLTHRDIVKKHLRQHRKARHSEFNYSIHITNNPTWIVFPLVNDSDEENWYISVGDYWEGRTGLAETFKIYEALSKKSIDFTAAGHIRGGAAGSFFSINIPKGKEALLVVQYVPEEGSLSNIPFRLIKENVFLSQSNSYMSFDNILLATLTFGILFFLSCMRSGENKKHALLVAFYVFAFAAFLVRQDVLYSDHVWAPYFPYILMSLMAYLAPSISLFYLNLKPHHKFFRFTLRGLSLLPICAVLLSIFMIEDGRDFALITSLANAICYLSLVGISTLFAIKRVQVAYSFVVGWFLVAIGTLISVLAQCNLITPYPSRIIAFDLSLIPMTFALVYAAHMRYESYVRSIKRRLDMHEIEDPILNQLKQSKESANQERLLRVIERERQSLEQMRYQEQVRREEMAKAKEAADTANNSKSAFLAMISHEIRTPMNGVMGMVRLLLDTKLSKDQHDFALTIQDSGEAMVTLLNDILDFEKIETGKLDLENIDFDVHRLIQGVTTLMKGHAANKELEILFEIDETVPQYLVGDPTRIRQILLNLTNNAIKFTETGHVKILAKASQVDLSESFGAGADGFSEEYMLYIAVEDTGIGINKDAQKTLFDPFSQADSSITRKYGGSGLGLAICQGLVERMNSSIRIKSNEGEGSTFYFTIRVPAGVSPDEGSQSNSGSYEELKRKDDDSQKVPQQRILVVEDNLINQKVLIGILQKDGHIISAVSNAPEVFEQMRRETFDCILMDIELVDANGMDITRQIRSLSNPEIAKTPIIAMTGHTDDKTRDACFDSGMNDFITKPVIPETLRDIIRRLSLGELQVMEAEVSIVPQSEQSKLSENNSHDIAGMEGDENFSFDDYDFDSEEFDSFAEALAQRKDDYIDDKGTLGEEPSQDDDSSLYGSVETLEKFESLKDDPFSTYTPAPPVSRESSYDIETFSDESKINQTTETNDVFDENMLSSLKDNLGPEQVIDLIDGLFEQVTTIEAAFLEALDDKDYKAIQDRAHELKGMAGNFGLTELASIASNLEKHLKNVEGNPDSKLVTNIIQSLIPQAHKRAKSTLDEWIK